MKKFNLVIVAKRPSTSRAVVMQLEALIGNFFSISTMSIQEGIKRPVEADLVLLTSLHLTPEVTPYINQGTDILVVRRTILKDSWEKVMYLPSRTKAMLVNDDLDSAVETIALLHELGAKHLELVPVYPGMAAFPQLPLAITPGEREFVPPAVTQIIDLGNRVVDSSTVVDILTKFSLFDESMNQMVADYMERTIPRSPGLQKAINLLGDMLEQTELILDIVHEGVIALDREGRVTLFNRMAERILKVQGWKALGQHLEHICPELAVSCGTGGDPVVDTLCRVGQQDLVVNRVPLIKTRVAVGAVITFKAATEIEELEDKLRRELKRKGYVARYTFEDIVFEGEAIRKVITTARKLTRGDSSILIQGESGTGKELFAQALHNASQRKGYPFVAVNCAALPHTLLESELFGYEEGAFTGAKRGGKAGLFEQAHRGTIFLDEIGDLPLELQARLLRVLQEKVVMRVGGSRVIPVDVRVIAATNRELERLVEEGAFRADLYYRLNVLPLKIPPLRQRKDDIPGLVRHFLHRLGYKHDLPADILEVFTSYHWPGNVRELENCIEYMVNISDGKLLLENLPDSIRRAGSGVPHMPFTERVNKPLVIPDNLLEQPEIRFLLRELYRAEKAGQKAGRRSLALQARAQGIDLGEQEVRSRLARLAVAGLVKAGLGRAGTRLTEEGRKIAETLTRSTG